MTAVITQIICPCCKIAIQLILEKLQMPLESFEEDRLTFSRELTPDEIHLINVELKVLYHEHEIVFERKRILAEKIAMILRERVTTIEHKDVEKLSPKEEEVALIDEIKKKTGLDYFYVLKIFEKIMNMTIVHYFITQKIRRAEQLIDGGMEISDVADVLKYSTLAYFSHQFKEINGICPRDYKNRKKGNSPES